MAPMECQVCAKRPSAVHVLEVLAPPKPGEPFEVRAKHVCESCAAVLDLPNAPIAKKPLVDIGILLQSAQRAAQEGAQRCPDCGMTLAEFRSKGRLGCPRDYEIFGMHLEPLLLRIHNASTHRGRTPGMPQAELERSRTIDELRTRLATAIREEAYEDAARLRDELAAIETGKQG